MHGHACFEKFWVEREEGGQRDSLKLSGYDIIVPLFTSYFCALSQSWHTAVCFEEKMRPSDLCENPLARQAINIQGNCGFFLVTFGLWGINCSVSDDKRRNDIKQVFIHNMVLFIYVTWSKINQSDIDAYGWAVLKRNLSHTKKHWKGLRERSAAERLLCRTTDIVARCSVFYKRCSKSWLNIGQSEISEPNFSWRDSVRHNKTELIKRKVKKQQQLAFLWRDSIMLSGTYNYSPSLSVA